MIDKDLISEMDYTDYMPVFQEFFKSLDKLDALEIRLIVGDRLVDRLEDSLIRLIYATHHQLTK